MNSIQIFEILSKDPYSKKYFQTVLAIDDLPLFKKKLKSKAYVINTDKRSRKGEHWLSVFYDGQSNCQFFDSLGFGPEIYNMEDFLKTTAKSIQINKFPVQSVFSEFCGFYSILFILIRSRRISYINFLGYFNSNTLKNDFNLNYFINNYISK
jgi:hypothetical protein